MMTNTRVLTELWDWRSPAWWIAVAAIVAYVVRTRRDRAAPRQIIFLAAAAASLIIALASPLAALASRYLFSAHMAQHMLLLLIVPLCAMLAWPSRSPDDAESRTNLSEPRPSGSAGVAHHGKPAFLQSSLPHGRGSLSSFSDRRMFEDPRRPAQGVIPAGWLAGVGAMWFWHIPALCTASMRSPIVFGIQAFSLVAAGAAFWWPVFRPIASRRMQPHLAAVYLFAGCIGCSLLGIYITFSPLAVCPLYAQPAGSNELITLIRTQWGITPRIDQQIGGLLMWVPACMIYLSAPSSR